MRDDTFRDMARTYPRVAPIRELRSALSGMRLASLQVGDDGRNRCRLSPFRARTGRNQPSNSKFIFGPSVWLRGLIRPRPGWGLAYVDWSQQEFGIAAALSGDPAMKEAYTQRRPLPSRSPSRPGRCRRRHQEDAQAEREQFKACVLAVQYGMGEASLASAHQPAGGPRTPAPGLAPADLSRRSGSGRIVRLMRRCSAADCGPGFGWQIHTRDEINDRSLRNFPMQANGAEMLRIACIFF